MVVGVVAGDVAAIGWRSEAVLVLGVHDVVVALVGAAAGLVWAAGIHIC